VSRRLSLRHAGQHGARPAGPASRADDRRLSLGRVRFTGGGRRQRCLCRRARGGK
jgi:hypothetical protein